MPPRNAPLSFAQVASLARALPDVVVSTSYGTDALKVKDKLLARMWDDGTTMVLRLPFTVRDHLISAEPERYFLTDHYKAYPCVLVRLGAVTAGDLTPLLEEGWRQVAPKRLVTAFDQRAKSGPRRAQNEGG